MALLPPSMQDKTEFLPLGKAVQKPEPVKADPVRDFERHNHDVPESGIGSWAPDFDLKNAIKITQVEFDQGVSLIPGATYLIEDAILCKSTSPLTWPTLPDLPEPTFLPQVVNQASQAQEGQITRDVRAIAKQNGMTLEEYIDHWRIKSRT